MNYNECMVLILHKTNSSSSFSYFCLFVNAHVNTYICKLTYLSLLDTAPLMNGTHIFEYYRSFNQLEHLAL